MPSYDVDLLAAHLSDWATRACSMPPSFMGGGDKVVLADPDGHHLGFVLPGHGVLVDVDLKELGITRPIPGVFERSPVRRAIDRMSAHVDREVKWLERLWKDERGAINTFDGIIAARNTTANDPLAAKNTFTTSATAWFSAFGAAGMPPAGSYTSGSGSSFNNASTGALSNGLTDPGAGATKYLTTFGFGSSVAINMGMLVDILVGAGNLSGSSTSTQTINTTPLTRYTSGVGVMACIEITSAIGATPANVTGTYVNQAGTGSRTFTSTAMTPSALQKRLQPSLQMPVLPLQGTDYGVRSVADITLSASMGAGGFAVVLYKPLIMIPGIAANIFVERPMAAAIDGIVALETEAGGSLGCLALFIFPSSTSSGEIGMALRSCAG